MSSWQAICSLVKTNTTAFTEFRTWKHIEPKSILTQNWHAVKKSNFVNGQILGQLRFGWWNFNTFRPVKRRCALLGGSHVTSLCRSWVRSGMFLLCARNWNFMELRGCWSCESFATSKVKVIDQFDVNNQQFSCLNCSQFRFFWF
jgi:hypothetical protein